ncbi:MAG: hypothetical protein ACI9C2_000141 [Gammaproteobacteria bacterium]|jgi:hypothetical protein
MTPPGIQFGIVALALGLVSFRPSLVEAPPVAQDEQEVSVPGAPDARQPIQWRVIWTTDPQHTATISWSTVADTKDNHLWIRPMQADAEARKVGAQRNGAFTLNGTEKKSVEPMYYHHVRLDGLEPGTRYEFELDSDGSKSRALSFRAAPAVDSTESFSLIYGGDSRTGKEDRQRMNRLSAELTSNLPDVIAFVHGGDYVFDGRMFAQWNDWLSHDELRTTADGRVLPIVPTRGNHDGGYIFDEVFDTPGAKGENYYHTTLPSNVNLLTLNTNISHAGDQRVWLARQLESLRPDSRWLLAQYHRPAYPAVKEPGDAKAAWVPLFEAHDVDLVFESDGHAIKRTMAIRDDKPDPTGVVYIGEGGLGVPQRTPYSDRWYLQEPGMSGRGHHLTTVSFSGDELRLVTQGFSVDEESGRIADPEGEPVIFDKVVMQRRGAK